MEKEEEEEKSMFGNVSTSSSSASSPSSLSQRSKTKMKNRKVSPSEDSFDVLQMSGNRKEILRQLSNQFLWEKSRSGKTAFHHILLNSSTDGISLATKKLNNCVNQTDDGYVEDSSINIDLRHVDVNILKDLLRYKSNVKVQRLLKHPTIKIFLNLKWHKVKLFFLMNFLIYLTFLFIYSAFLGDIFYRRANKRPTVGLEKIVVNDRIFFTLEDAGIFVDNNSKKSPPFMHEIDEEEITLKKDSKKEKSFKLRSTFSKCSSRRNGGIEYRSLVCTIEISLTICVLLLFIQELIQLLALKPKSYFRELENWLELLIIAIVTVSLIIKRDLETFKWLSAIGICLSYLELIFLMGRYPFLGGRISLMFYSITRHVYKSLLTLLILIVGFAFGFFIISHSKPNDHFENPAKSILKTLVMTLGEFEFNDLYAAHSEDVVSLTFTMVLLVGLIIVGSFILVNLLVAIIVSDLSELREAGLSQELLNKAQQIIHVESTISYISESGNKFLTIPDSITVCSHSICQCKNMKFPEEIEDLKQIIRSRKLKQELLNLPTDSRDKFACIMRDILTNKGFKEIVRDVLVRLT